MLRSAIAIVLVLLACSVATAAERGKIYRVDLRIDEQGQPPSTPLLLVEGGKDASMELTRPDGTGRRYEVRVDADQDEQGRTTGTVALRVVDLRQRGERVLGSDVVEIERLGKPYKWQPDRKVKGLAIDVILYLQPI